MKCPSCDLDFKSYTAVSLHFRNKHGNGAELREIMRLKLVAEKHGGVTPTCKCGCGGVPKYYDYDRGYVEYIRGHQARIHNNWGHNEQALAKSHATTKARYDAGDLQVWNKGLTSDSDEHVAAYGESVSNTLLSDPKHHAQRSSHMASQWETGSITPLTGSSHPMWAGGTSALQPLVRSHLHAIWTYPKLRASNFTCQDCGANHVELHVHHDGERFASILRKAIAVLGAAGDDFEKKAAVANWVADYHVQNDVSGVVLCERCHQERHVAA